MTSHMKNVCFCCSWGVARKSKECRFVALSKKGFVPYDKDKKNQDAIICHERLSKILIYIPVYLT